jgi:hypothetical protein
MRPIDVPSNVLTRSVCDRHLRLGTPIDHLCDYLTSRRRTGAKISSIDRLSIDKYDPIGIRDEGDSDEQASHRD